MRKLPDTTLAWLAALIDGEGSVMFTSRYGQSSKKHRSVYFRTVVGVYNTDYRLMKALLEKTGIGRIRTHTRKPVANRRKTAYAWVLNTTEIEKVMPVVLPWLVLKKKQTELLLEAIKLSRDSDPRTKRGWTVGGCVKNSKRKKQIAELIKALNRKGKENV